MKAYEVHQTDVREGIQVGERKLANGTVIKFNLIALQTEKEVGERVYDVATVPTRSGKTKLREVEPRDDGKAVIILHGYCCYRGGNRVTWNEKVTELAKTLDEASPRGSLGWWTSHVLVCEEGAMIMHVASGRHSGKSDIQYITWDGENVKLVTQEEVDLT